MQAVADALAERLVQALVGTGGEAVDRDAMSLVTLLISLPPWVSGVGARSRRSWVGRSGPGVLDIAHRL
jgi:hypothetical protein